MTAGSSLSPVEERTVVGGSLDDLNRDWLEKYAGCQPVRRNQLLAGFMRDYKSTVTGGSFVKARGEGFLNLVRDSLKLSGRRPDLEQIGEATNLTIYAARYEDG